MRLKMILAAVVAVVVLAGCSSSQGARSAAGPESASAGSASLAASPDPADSDEADPLGPAKLGSWTTYLTVESQLRDPSTGDSIPITWKVTNVEKEYRGWDGPSRPDNPPPDGLQGLVQTAESGKVKIRMESRDSGTFVLTPHVSIDGQDIELVFIEVNNGRWDFPERLYAAGEYCINDGEGYTVTMSTKIPTRGRQLLVYDYVMQCVANKKGGSTILIRTYQRN